MATKKKAKAPTAMAKDSSATGIMDLIMGVEKQTGLRHVDLQVRTDDVLRSGCLTLDLIQGGGYFGGRILSYYGPPGAGKSTMALISAAHQQRRGIPTMFFDHEGTTDRAYSDKLAASLGVDIGNRSKLLRYTRPDDGVQTFETMLKIMQGLPDADGGLPPLCFFIDSIAMMPTRGEMEDWDDNHRMAQRAAMHSEWMTRLRTLVSKKNVSVIAVNQIRANPRPYAPPEARPGGNAWEFAIDNLIKVRKAKPVEVGGEVFQPMKFKTEKNKNFISHQEAEVHLNLGKGIDPASDVIQFLKLIGCYKKVQEGKKKLPAIVGLGPDFDMVYRGAAALEDAIRDERQEALANPLVAAETLYGACEALLESGEAVKRYMEQKKKPKDDDDDVEDDEQEQKERAVTKKGSVTGKETSGQDDQDGAEDEPTSPPKLGKKKS
jgi:RecA/RadA recombinase